MKREESLQKNFHSERATAIHEGLKKKDTQRDTPAHLTLSFSGGCSQVFSLGPSFSYNFFHMPTFVCASVKRYSETLEIFMS